MIKNKFYKDVLKAVIVISAILALCKVTMGVVAVFVAVVGAYSALARKSGLLAICYILIPIFSIFNRVIVGVSPIFLMVARIGNLIMIGAMILTGAGFTGRMRERLPIGWMFAYCFVAALSSIDGWMPLISYLKITQFILFLLGLLFITRILQQSDEGLYQIRCFLMAFAIIFLVGSLVSKFIPSVGSSMHIEKMASWGIYMDSADVAASEGMVFFNGMTCHSQMLAPVVSLMAAWVLCDMLLVEKSIGFLHLTLLATSPILLYLSRSRGGFFELVSTLAVAIFICLPRARLQQVVKSRLFLMLIAGVLLLLIMGIVGQIRNQSISKWLRKTEDVKGDTRSLTEAVTGSRQFLIDYNLSDFKLNPVFGKGFQVMRGMEKAYRAKMITWYSASVEKGVTPYVILGETGLMGAVVFVIFLIAFYSTCFKRRYLSLMTSFTCVLVCNMADSTLFSPGGLGGFLWIITCVGAFSTDLISIRQAHGVWTRPEVRC